MDTFKWTILLGENTWHGMVPSVSVSCKVLKIETFIPLGTGRWWVVAFLGFYHGGTHLRHRLVLRTLRSNFLYCLFMFPPRLFFLLVVKQGVRGSEVWKISAMLFLLTPKNRLRWRYYHILRLSVCYWPLDFGQWSLSLAFLEMLIEMKKWQNISEVFCAFSSDSISLISPKDIRLWSQNIQRVYEHRLYTSALLETQTNIYDVSNSKLKLSQIWFSILSLYALNVCTWEMGWLTYTQPVRGLTLRYSGWSLDIEYVTAALVPKSSSCAATRRKLVPIMVSSRRKSTEGEEEMCFGSLRSEICHLLLDLIYTYVHLHSYRMFSNLGLLSFWSRMRMLSWQMPISGSAAWSVAVTVTAYSRWRSRSNFLAVTITPRDTDIMRLIRKLYHTKHSLVLCPQSICNLTLKTFPLFALNLNLKDRRAEWKRKLQSFSKVLIIKSKENYF